MRISEIEKQIEDLQKKKKRLLQLQEAQKKFQKKKKGGKTRKYIFDERCGKIRGEFIEIKANNVEEAIEKFKKIKDVVEVVGACDKLTKIAPKVFVCKDWEEYRDVKIIGTK